MVRVLRDIIEYIIHWKLIIRSCGEYAIPVRLNGLKSGDVRLPLWTNWDRIETQKKWSIFCRWHFRCTPLNEMLYYVKCISWWFNLIVCICSGKVMIRRRANIWTNDGRVCNGLTDWPSAKHHVIKNIIFKYIFLLSSAQNTSSH